MLLLLLQVFFAVPIAVDCAIPVLLLLLLVIDLDIGIDSYVIAQARRRQGPGKEDPVQVDSILVVVIVAATIITAVATVVVVPKAARQSSVVSLGHKSRGIPGGSLQFQKGLGGGVGSGWFIAVVVTIVVCFSKEQTAVVLGQESVFVVGRKERIVAVVFFGHGLGGSSSSISITSSIKTRSDSSRVVK